MADVQNLFSTSHFWDSGKQLATRRWKICCTYPRGRVGRRRVGRLGVDLVHTIRSDPPRLFQSEGPARGANQPGGDGPEAGT